MGAILVATHGLALAIAMLLIWWRDTAATRPRWSLFRPVASAVKAHA